VEVKTEVERDAIMSKSKRKPDWREFVKYYRRVGMYRPRSFIRKKAPNWLKLEFAKWQKK